VPVFHSSDAEGITISVLPARKIASLPSMVTSYSAATTLFAAKEKIVAKALIIKYVLTLFIKLLLSLS
jgi:hypothetical protein